MPLSLSEIISSVIAGAALVLGIVNFIQAREPVVRWRVELDQDEGRIPNSGRLINESQRFAAIIIAIEDPDVDLYPDGGPSSKYEGSLPAVVEPGNSIPVRLWQFLNREPARVTVIWRQRRAHGRWVRPIRRKVTLYR